MLASGRLALVDILIIVTFLVVVTVAGYMLSRAASKGIDDYFLGGKKIPWWVLGISTSTSNFDMAGTMIIVAMVFVLGYKGFLVELRGGVGFALVFLMIFLGKWLRRSRVMTSAQWMMLRFGTDRQGQAAHILSAVANIVLSLGLIIYFSKGAGKFVTHFIPVSEFTAISIMVSVGLFYTLMSGLYGVVFTDVIQMVVLGFTALYISAYAFDIVPTINLPDGFLAIDLASPEYVRGSLLAASPDMWEPILTLFGVSVFIWMARSTMEGMGGIGGYTDQRFFAARTEREASLLTFESILLSALRWAMVAGVVVMAFAIVQAGGAPAEVINQDPERALPVVLGTMLPDGIRGIVIVGLIAAAMSTFDSTLNAGASYIVKDIYQTYLNPQASAGRLVAVSRWATVALCFAGVGLALLVPDINQIWKIITMGLGAGLFVPLFLRWYWPRLNGYGFAIGTATGIVCGLVFQAALNWPLHLAFPLTVLITLVASVISTLLTRPTDEEVLVHFWHQINPWGGWRRYANKAHERGLVRDSEIYERTVEKTNDFVALAFAVPFQLSLLLGSMALIFHDWDRVGFFGILVGLLGLGLYFFWYKNLKSDAQCKQEDEYFEPLVNERIAPRTRRSENQSQEADAAGP